MQANFENIPKEWKESHISNSRVEVYWKCKNYLYISSHYKLKKTSSISFTGTYLLSRGNRERQRVLVSGKDHDVPSQDYSQKEKKKNKQSISVRCGLK